MNYKQILTDYITSLSPSNPSRSPSPSASPSNCSASPSEWLRKEMARSTMELARMYNKNI